jgi:hypothetical protein
MCIISGMSESNLLKDYGNYRSEELQDLLNMGFNKADAIKKMSKDYKQSLFEAVIAQWDLLN